MTWWIGESGVLTPLTLVVAAVIYSRGRWQILPQPPKRNDASVATSPTPQQASAGH